LSYSALMTDTAACTAYATILSISIVPGTTTSPATADLDFLGCRIPDSYLFVLICCMLSIQSYGFEINISYIPYIVNSYFLM